MESYRFVPSKIFLKIKIQLKGPNAINNDVPKHYIYRLTEETKYNPNTIQMLFNVLNKRIIDTRTKFSIYARRAFRLQKTHQ